MISIESKTFVQQKTSSDFDPTWGDSYALISFILKSYKLD